VQITQNTYNFNTNPSLTNTPPPPQQQQLATNDTTRVLNQTIGSQTNVNVILNQTVIQQQQPTVQTTSTANQQQMVAININGNQTLIPLSMFTKLLQQKYSSTQQSTTNVKILDLKLFLNQSICIILAFNSHKCYSTNATNTNYTKWFDFK
jgi:hypothetical protein